MRIILLTLGIMMLGFSMVGCAQPSDGTEEFQAAHPEYNHRPAYFDEKPTYGKKEED